MASRLTSDKLDGLRTAWSLDGAPDSLAKGLTYAKGMHARPFDYYVARIAQLGLKGQRVLDAGCGTGTWSFALRTAFDEVVGIDHTEERIRVAQWLAEEGRVPGMDFRVASILDTGLPDQSVDAVFCYSVLISSLSVKDALAEFHRVLRPGGVAYVSLNGIGWSYYLRDERGKNDPKLAEMGRQGIYNTLVRSIPQTEVNAIYSRYAPATGQTETALAAWLRLNWTRAKKLTLRIGQRLGLTGPSASSAAASRAHAQLQAWSRYLAPLGLPPSRLQQVAEVIREDCGNVYYAQLAIDVFRMAKGIQTSFSHADAGRGYTPDEMRAICESVGLIDFQWAAEGSLAGAVLPDPPKPAYAGYVGPHLKVWEFLAFRPAETLGQRLSPDWFRANTRQQALLPYIAQARLPLLTNVDAATVPPGWVEEARRRAAAAGSDQLIAALAEKLCAGADDDEERIARLVRFVQDVLIHHPVVQPFEHNGTAVTDPATLLFLGIGRCGAAAPLVASLCRAVGIETRVERPPGHVIAVAKVGDQEIILEADAFKKGVILREPDGRLLRYTTLIKTPVIADGLPDFPSWWTIHYRDRTDVWGRRPFGYIHTDGGMTVYSSYFEPKADIRRKPKSPSLTAARNGSMVRLSWDDARPIDGADVCYRVVARRVSRGWSYDNEPDDIAPILSPPPATIEEWTEATHIDLTAPEDMFFEVTPRLKARPDVFCWPSNETFSMRKIETSS